MKLATRKGPIDYKWRQRHQNLRQRSFHHHTANPFPVQITGISLCTGNLYFPCKKIAVHVIARTPISKKATQLSTLVKNT